MKTVLILGPLPPPYMGPAIATENILNSRLRDQFKIIHLNTNTHKTISTLGSLRLSVFLKNAGFYLRQVSLLIRHWPKLVLIPISQTTGGFIKDSIFILISRLFGRKIILHLRGGNFKNWLAGSSLFIRNYVKIILKQTKGVIVLGNKLRYLFIGYYQENQIFVVPNGANLSIKVEKKSNKSFKLLYLSNMQPSKGIEDVLDAVAIISYGINRTRFELNVVGEWWDNNTRERCLNLVKVKKLSVHFNPPVIGNDKFKYFEQSDVFIFTPRDPEGHPWVIVEAMAAGLPIISTDQGAISESVIDGVNGFIVNARSPGAISEKLKILIEDSALREKMGRESRRMYEEKFTEDKMVERLTNVFNHVLTN